MTIAIVDYGMGNLASVSRALGKLGQSSEVVDDPDRLDAFERIILPGVGSFADGVAGLRRRGWFDVLRAQVRAGKPLLGICLGMQLLADRGTEWGEHEGLGLIPGQVDRLDEFGCKERIPHVGWNDVRFEAGGDLLLDGIADGSDFYFVHSFAFRPQSGEHVLATVDYGVRFPVVVRSGHAFGTQFHPEKSSRAGLRLLANFAGYRPC